MDAGFTLARPHWFKLVFMWSVLAIPFFLIPFLLLPDNPIIAMMIGWWFKPLYETPILIYLSSALFGETLPVKVALKRSLRHIKRLLFSYLSFARLSTHRSLTMPVVILEQLGYKKNRQRIAVLSASVNRAFTMQIVCLHVEYLLMYGFMALALFLVPTGELFNGFQFMQDIFDTEYLPRWYWILSTATFFLAAALVAPFFVGAGFMLYINRRMKIEAWDIEHQFRRIVRERSASSPTQARTQSSIASVLCLVLLAALYTTPSEAQNNEAEESQIETIATPLALNSDELPTVAKAKELIAEVKGHEDFGYTTEKRVLRFKERPDKNSDPSEFEPPEWLKNLGWLPNALHGLANMLQWILWVLAAFLIVIAVMAIMKFLPENVRATLKPRSGVKERVKFEVHPLTTNLPEDIPGAANNALNSGNKREALSLLYRGAIRALINQHQLPVPKGATESECLSLVGAKAAQTQKSAFKSLVSHWQQTAYARVDHDEQSIASLIQNWPEAFGPRSSNQQAVS